MTAPDPAQFAENVRHKIVEAWTGGGMLHGNRCMCGWQASSRSLKELDALSEAHTDGSKEAS